jgi:hypothetical protein
MIRRWLVWLPVVLSVTAVPALAATVTVRADKTPLRAAASNSALVVAELKAGTVLELVDVDRDWYRVRDPRTKREGFLPASAVVLQPGPAPVAGSPQKPGTKPVPARSAPKPRRVPRKGDWTDSGYLFVNGMFEGGSSPFTQSQSWTYFAETATATVEYPARNAAGFDVAGGVRVWRNLAVGAGVTIVSRSTTATYTGSIPNPLYLNRPSTVSGSFAASNTETGIHLQAAWGIPVSPKMLVVVFAGPSIFSVSQTVLQSQGLTVSSGGYPYDRATATAATSSGSKTAIGFGAGADISYYFSKTMGVGGMIRFTRATASIATTGQPDVAVTAGGFQVGGGIRIRFPAPKPARPATPKPTPPPRKD